MTGKFDNREEQVRYMTSFGMHTPDCPLPTGRPAPQDLAGLPDWTDCTCP